MKPFKHQEAWTPAAGDLTTTKYGGTRKLKRACFSVDTDGTISYRTEGGSTITDYPVVAGIIYMQWVDRITAYSGTTVYIHHNGELLR